MLNAAASLAAKRTGQQLAIDFAGQPWNDAVLAELRGWCAIRKAQGHSTMTMEEFRHEAANHPASHKAWGALPLQACRLGILRAMEHPDGSPVVRRAASERTHAHPVRVWGIA